MMHASTSPLYPIIVSNDITAAMMDGPGGLALTNESIQEAVAFRQTMGRVHRQFAQKNDWFFNTWNAGHGEGSQDRQEGPRSRTRRRSCLATDPDCWVLHPGDALARVRRPRRRLLHAGSDQGVGGDARAWPTRAASTSEGIPATLVTAYLHRRGVEVEKTTDFTILFLFSIGITKGKWGTLLNALLDFKRDYDRNAPLAEVLPDLVDRVIPAAYGGSGSATSPIRCSRSSRRRRQTHWLAEAFSTLPTPVMTPNAAYQHLVRDEIEHVPLDQLANRVLATSVVPYPPGIPDAHAGRGDRRRRRPLPELPARAVRRGIAASRASGTTRMASRTATAPTTCSA